MGVHVFNFRMIAGLARYLRKKTKHFNLTSWLIPKRPFCRVRPLMCIRKTNAEMVNQPFVQNTLKRSLSLPVNGLLVDGTRLFQTTFPPCKDSSKPVQQGRAKKKEIKRPESFLLRIFARCVIKGTGHFFETLSVGSVPTTAHALFSDFTCL